MMRIAAFLMLLLSASMALAVEPGERLSDPALEARARALSRELRCVVCQSESIDDSNAPLAADLRKLVRERIVAGDTDKQVIAFMVARYGDIILLRTPFDVRTVLLWFTPLAVFALGLAAVVMTLRRQSQQVSDESDEG